MKEVAPVIAGYWEKAEFPHELVPKLAKLGLGGGTLTGYGCPGHSILEAAMVCHHLCLILNTLISARDHKTREWVK